MVLVLSLKLLNKGNKNEKYNNTYLFRVREQKLLYYKKETTGAEEENTTEKILPCLW